MTTGYIVDNKLKRCHIASAKNNFSKKMKASDLIICIEALIHQYGDLETIVDCESVPIEIDSVSVLTEPYSKNPVFLISPLQDSLFDEKLDNGE
jgi:hypothetical protein